MRAITNLSNQMANVNESLQASIQFNQTNLTPLEKEKVQHARSIMKAAIEKANEAANIIGHIKV